MKRSNSIDLVSDEIIYVMEKWVMSDEDYNPEELKKFYGIKPYHNGWFMIVTAKDANSLSRNLREFSDLDCLADFLKPFSGKYKIKGERHNEFPEEVNIRGDVEKYCGIQWEDYSKLRKKGIEIEEFGF